MMAELTVLTSLVAVALHVLGPEQLQGYALGLQLLMDLEVVGFGKARRRRLGREQLGLQPRFVRALRQRPGDALCGGQADVLAHHALGEAAGTGNAFVAQAGFVIEAQDLDDLSHGNPRCRHPPFLVMKKNQVCRIKLKNSSVLAVIPEERDRGFRHRDRRFRKSTRNRSR